MIKIISVSAIVIILGIATTSYVDGVAAGSASYSCEVKNVYRLSKDTKLEKVGPIEEKILIDSRFSVDRNSGQIIGETVSTATATSTTVIQYGDGNKSFRSVADWNDPHGATRAYLLLEIQEFEKVSEKPFVVFVSGGSGIFSGKCR